MAATFCELLTCIWTLTSHWPFTIPSSDAWKSWYTWLWGKSRLLAWLVPTQFRTVGAKAKYSVNSVEFKCSCNTSPTQTCQDPDSSFHRDFSPSKAKDRRRASQWSQKSSVALAQTMLPARSTMEATNLRNTYMNVHIPPHPTPEHHNATCTWT